MISFQSCTPRHSYPTARLGPPHPTSTCVSARSQHQKHQLVQINPHPTPRERSPWIVHRKSIKFISFPQNFPTAGSVLQTQHNVTSSHQQKTNGFPLVPHEPQHHHRDQPPSAGVARLLLSALCLFLGFFHPQIPPDSATLAPDAVPAQAVRGHQQGDAHAPVGRPRHAAAAVGDGVRRVQAGRLRPAGGVVLARRGGQGSDGPVAGAVSALCVHRGAGEVPA